MANDENLKNGVATQFRAGEEQAKIASKGGKASVAARRKKNAFRNYLREVLAYKPVMTPGLRKNLADMGADPDGGEFNIEKLAAIALGQKIMKSDVKAIELVLETLGEDARSVVAEKQLKAQKEALNVIRNADGFMDAMSGMVGEVFEDGGDTPDTIEDSE